MDKDFYISAAPQRSPEWFSERAGKPSASRLGALMDTLKSGAPSQKQKDYLMELAYERVFGVNFDHYVNDAMRDGLYFEDLARQLYTRDTGNEVKVATSYVSDWFVATPDGLVDTDGLLECKVVRDNTFLSILENGQPREHYLQCQGQLMATGRKWVDYIAVNIKTKAYIVMRVERDKDTIKGIYDRLHEELELPELDTSHIKRFDDKTLQSYMNSMADDNNINDNNLPF